MENIDVRSLALAGAAARIEALRAELSSLQAFVGHKPTTNGNHPTRRGYAMSAAAKKAVSVRMKKYWAERRAKGKAKGK